MRHVIGIGIGLALLTFLPGLHAAAPPNDQFASRIILNSTSLTTTGSNIDATKQSGEPDHADNPGGQSVWWAWTAPSDGDLTIDTDGSNFDTLLGVYTGSSVSALSLVVSNDDHGADITSRVRFQAVAGTQYQIAVDGFSDGSFTDSGDITLNIVFIPQPISRPPNDNFANRTPLTGLPVTAGGSDVLATREPGEPLHAGQDGDTSVWWTWTAQQADTVRVSTAGSTFDTLLAVYIGSSLSKLIEVASNDDADALNDILTSELTFNAVAGQTYQIAVDGFDGDSGQVVLRLSSVSVRLVNPARLADGNFQFTLTGPAGTTNKVEATTDLTNWTALGTVVATNGSAPYRDLTATNFNRRFYRAFASP